MVLPPIPADPRPTEAEIDAEIERGSITAVRADIVRTLARLHWKGRMKAADPDLFLEPFATGVPNYKAYLRSPIWKKIRAEVLEAADYECAGCVAEATQVHHRDYRPRVLAGEDRVALVPLCKDCHDFIHKGEDGKSRETWNESEELLAELVISRPEPFSFD